MPKTFLEDQYELSVKIGSGQFGEVKLATSMLDGNLYVCKSIHKPTSDSISNSLAVSRT